MVTFARFYAAHVLLLPPLTMLLIGVHVYSGPEARRGAGAGDDTAPKQEVFPSRCSKIPSRFSLRSAS